MTTVEILRKAKTVIERFGWCQGDYGDKSGRVCILGACRRAATWIYYPDKVERLVRPLLPRIHGSVSAWNDEPGRTKKDVLQALDRAIVLAAADSRDEVE